MTTNLEQIQRLAKDSTVEPARGGLSITGISFFELSERNPPNDRKPRTRRVALVDGSEHLLDGALALRVALDLGRDEPKQMALATVFLLGPVNNVAETTEDLNPAEKQYAGLIKAPHVSKNILEFWGYDAPSRKQSLYQVRVDIDEGEVHAVLAENLTGAKKSDPITSAKAALLTTDLTKHTTALDVLVSLCSNARAVSLMTSTAKSHKNDETRAQAISRMPRCDSGDRLAVLTEALASDKSVRVRVSAAVSLGWIGDTASRPALEKARTSDADSEVRRAATVALNQLSQ